MSNLDLSGLNNFSDFLNDPKAGDGASGVPLALPLANVDEDPDQPRTDFDDAALGELAESIKARGVKTPISVRPHPDGADRYIVNHGARRLRGARLAGLDTIPAFVDADHGYVDQLVENIQRENLTTAETIQAVGRMLGDGKKQTDIARETGKSKSWVSKYAKLQNMPIIVAAALEDGRCKDGDALVGLMQCWDMDNDATKELLQAAVITAPDVSRLRAQIEHAQRGGVGDGGTEPTEPTESGERGERGAEVPGRNIGDDNGEETGAPAKPPGEPAADKNHKPQIEVKVGKREGVLLFKKTCEYGLAWVEYEDGSEELVDANKIRLVAVLDAKKGQS